METNKYELAYPNPVPEGVSLEKNLYAEMRDGIKIAVDVYKPADAKGALPVILAYSSFPKERIFESAKPSYYCKHGYICVQASERGIGLNEGKFSFQGPKAAEDGYDLIEWIAAQPWCDGNVAMMGASGYGVMQWLTAPLNPPHLKALVVLATTDNYRGLCYPGGVLRKAFVEYLITSMTIGAYWPGPVPNKEEPMNVMGGILSNNEDGPFWHEHGSAFKTVGQIKTPVLNLVQAPNRLHAIYQLRSYPEIKAPKKLWLTPWTNENYQPWIFETTAFNDQIRRWFDHWLKGIDTGLMQEPEVAMYDNGTGQWHYEDAYPIERTVMKQFYLHAKTDPVQMSGLISETAPSENEGSDVYHNISLNADLTASYGANAAALAGKASDRPRYLTYNTPPLTEDLTLYGPASFTFYASTQEEITSDWCFFVKMGEMVPEGVPMNPVTGQPEIKPEINDPFTPPEVHIWSWGSLKAKYREVDESQSQPGIPWHPYNKPEDLKPGTVYEFEVEMQPIFKTFKKGCRLWLKIASGDMLYSTRDISSLYVETPIAPPKNEITVFCSAQYPSHLLLPVTAPAQPQKTALDEALPGAPRFILM